MEPSERKSKVFMGFLFLGVICFLNTVPLLAVSILANLTAVSRMTLQLQQFRLADRGVCNSSPYTSLSYRAGEEQASGENGESEKLARS